MPEFRYEPGQDSFKGCLLQLTRWKVADQFRQRRPAAVQRQDEDLGSGIGAPAAPGAPSDFEALRDAEWEQHLLTQVLARVKRQVNPEHYAIYHLNVIGERPMAEVRQTLGVSVAAISQAKHRVGAALKRELRRLRDVLAEPERNR